MRGVSIWGVASQYSPTVIAAYPETGYHTGVNLGKIMDIISRQEARLNFQKTYFTGNPCKSGHVAYRYTQSGSCSQCVKEANGSVVDPNAAAHKVAIGKLAQVRLRVYDEDRDTLAAAIWASAVMRDAVLTLGDIDPRRLPTDRAAGTGMYSFRCHDEDIAQVRELAAAMLRTHSINPEAVRERTIASQAVAVAPLPDWTERP